MKELGWIRSVWVQLVQILPCAHGETKAQKGEMTLPTYNHTASWRETMTATYAY